MISLVYFVVHNKHDVNLTTPCWPQKQFPNKQYSLINIGIYSHVMVHNVHYV